VILRFVAADPRLRICLGESLLRFRYTLYVGAPLRLYIPGGMCAQRCAGSFFKDSIDAPVNERASSIKRIVKNASTPMQITPIARTVAHASYLGRFRDSRRSIPSRRSPEIV
jgi:hypothetical protein